MPTPDELRAQAASLNARAQELETQLTAADVSRMSKENRYEEIEQARLDGRLAAVLGATPEGAQK